MKMNRSGVPKRRHIKLRRQGITQKKEHNTQNTVKVLNQEYVVFSLILLMGTSRKKALRNYLPVSTAWPLCTLHSGVLSKGSVLQLIKANYCTHKFYCIACKDSPCVLRAHRLRFVRRTCSDGCIWNSTLFHAQSRPTVTWNIKNANQISSSSAAAAVSAMSRTVPYITSIVSYKASSPDSAI